MTLLPDDIDSFLSIFDEAEPGIRSFPGCRHLELWQDERYKNILTTYSIWDDAAALERYRQSDLFRTTWSRTRPLFAAPPIASSHHLLRGQDSGLSGT